MKTRLAAAKDEAGFTIIEVMVAIVILLLGVLATTTLLNTANATTARNQERNGATSLVRDIIEAARALPYNQVKPTVDSSGASDTTVVGALQNMPPTGASSFADDDPSASGWQIVRRNIEYTVTLRACVVDDAKDKVVASHDPAAADGSGYYCPDLPTSPIGDSNGDDYHRIKVTASWTSNSCGGCGTPGAPNSRQTYSVSQTAVVINPTGGLGPAPIGQMGVAGTTCSSKTFTQKFEAGATGAVFTVQDPARTKFTATVPTSTDASGNPTYSFTYNLSPAPPDGTWEVDANAFNDTQLFGQVSVGFAYINCHEPPAVTGVSGGFDWRRCTVYPSTCGSGERIFDIDWDPSPDQDVVGYYVWRVNGVEDWKADPADTGPDTRVACVSRALQPPNDTTTIPGSIDFLEPFGPACWDASVPAQPSLGTIVNPVSYDGQRVKYWVQAIDPDPSVDPTGPSGLFVRPNPTNHSATLDVTENMLNIRPTSPALSIKNDNGEPCLSWTDSSDVDAQNNAIANPVRYYRIYRDANPVATVPVTYNNGSGNVSANVPDVPYKDRIGRATPNASGSCDTGNPSRSWFEDTTAGANNWNYWVTAVDQTYLESFPSNGVNWSNPGP